MSLVRTAPWIRSAVLAALLFGVATDAHAAFPGQPGRIAFSAETGRFEGQNAVLWDYNPRTRVRRQLTFRGPACSHDSEANWADGGPEYSPDGRWIAYLHSDNCHPEVHDELRIMRADGSQNRLLKRMAVNDPFSANVAFAPGGDRIALWDDPGFRDISGVTFVDPDTGTTTRSSWPAIFWERLDWSVTGRMVTAFANGRLYTGNPDGTDRRRITSVLRRGPLVSYDEGADWSPSGRRIAFVRKWVDTRCEDGCGVSHRTTIWTVSPGRPATRLGRTRSSGTCCPTFSPNGQQLAFIVLARYSDGPVFEAIAAIQASGSGPRLLLRATGRISAFFSLAWQPLPRRR